MYFPHSLPYLISSVISVLLVLSYTVESRRERSSSINRFTLHLYKHIAVREPSNFVLSGLSADTMMNIMLIAARGDTAKQLKKGLHYNKMDNHKVRSYFRSTLQTLNSENGNNTLKIRDSIWINENNQIPTRFVKLVKHNFMAEVANVDFTDGRKAEHEINSWADNVTEGLIPAVFDDPLDGFTKMVLVNVIYFKGLWKNKFDQDSTEEQTFYGKSGSSSAPIMNQFGKFSYRKGEHVSTLEMKYQGEHISMIILLPDSDIKTFERNLKFEQLHNLMSESRSMNVNVTIPHFQTESFLDLRKHLIEMGMGEVFSAKAQLPDLGQFVFASEFVQRARIRVYEKGSKDEHVAVAEDEKMNEEPPIFRADRPFVYVIIDRRTGVILLMGRLADID